MGAIERFLGTPRLDIARVSVICTVQVILISAEKLNMRGDAVFLRLRGRCCTTAGGFHSPSRR